jgi:ribose/xylose/arabinose/galactoside ABC-type transport system permease subunit
MIGGGIDLSVANQMSITGVIIAIMMIERQVGAIPAMIVGILIGTFLGFINGYLIATVKGIFPLILTIAMGNVFNGVSYIISGAKTYRPFPEDFRFLAVNGIFGFNYDLIIAIVMLFIAEFVLRKTHIGRRIYATGGNREAARLSGINVDAIQIFSYSLCGFMFSLAAMDLMAKGNSVSTSILGTSGVAFTCMTAAIIGGISFMGGKGSMFGLIAGVFVIQILGNGMQLAGWGTYLQYVVQGIILIFALSFDAVKYTLSKKGAQVRIPVKVDDNGAKAAS